MSDKNKEMQIINENLRKFFDPMKKRLIAGPYHGTGIAYHKGNTLAHEVKKWILASKLIREGRTIITEGIMLNGRRPDITVLDLKTPICYEIMKSEQMSSIIDKMEDYGITIIPVPCDDVADIAQSIKCLVLQGD